MAARHEVRDPDAGASSDLAPAPEPPPVRSYDPRTRRLLEGPITSTLLRLAAPNVLVLVAQASAGLIEAYFIGRLGTDALAGVALVFPAFMLMQMMSAGAMGGGASSAVARALGGGRRGDADALAVHALVVGALFGLAFTVLVLATGPWLYGAMGGSGAALEAALTYSNLLFAGIVLVWLYNVLASVIRGTGNMTVPAVVTMVGTAALLPLSPALIFGFGPLPRLGIAGGALALLIFYAVGTAVLAAYVWSGRSVVRPALHGLGLRWPLFWDILRVGLVAALVNVATNLTIAVATAQVGQFGAAAIAGYGTGARLEYLLIPLVFGLGGPLVAMIGTSLGAGQRDRAMRTAWIGAGIAFALCETIGLTAALFPHAWLGLFDDDPAMLATGAAYLQTVGPAYGLFGLGMALYFASQGAARLLWPLLANILRLAIAAGGGWLALRLGGGIGSVYAAQSAALVAFGLVIAIAVAGGAWFPKQRGAGSPKRRGDGSAA